MNTFVSNCIKNRNIGYILMLEKKKISEVIQWKYIQIVLSFQCKQNVSKCNKKPTGNIGYILQGSRLFGRNIPFILFILKLI